MPLESLRRLPTTSDARRLESVVREQVAKREEEQLKAYVLIQTEGNREPIAELLRGMPGVISAQDLTGPYDAIALARSDSTGSLTEQVVAEIQKLPGVIRALSAPLIGTLGQVGRTALGGHFEAA